MKDDRFDNDSSPHDNCPYAKRARQWLWDGIPPVLLLTGLLGNLLIISVFLRPRLRARKPVLCLTLILLAVFDILTHLFGLTHHWLRKASYAASFDVQKVSASMCKFHEFGVYFTLTYSTWILVVISVERFLIFFVHVKTNRFLSLNRLILVFIGLAVACAGLHGHFLWTHKVLDRNGRSRECTYTNASAHFMRAIQPKIDIIFSSIIPFFLLVAFNICTIMRMFHSETKYSERILRLGTTRLRQRLDVTKMLLAAIAFFIVCTLPAKLFIMLYPSKVPQGTPLGSCTYHRFKLAFTAVLLLQFSNNCVNLYIYCLASRYFRRDLCDSFLFQGCFRWSRRRAHQIRGQKKGGAEGLDDECSVQNSPENKTIIPLVSIQ